MIVLADGVFDPLHAGHTVQFVNGHTLPLDGGYLAW